MYVDIRTKKSSFFFAEYSRLNHHGTPKRISCIYVPIKRKKRKETSVHVYRKSTTAKRATEGFLSTAKHQKKSTPVPPLRAFIKTSPNRGSFFFTLPDVGVWSTFNIVMMSSFFVYKYTSKHHFCSSEEGFPSFQKPMIEIPLGYADASKLASLYTYTYIYVYLYTSQKGFRIHLAQLLNLLDKLFTITDDYP